MEQIQVHDLGYLLQHVAAMMHRQADQMLQERLGIGMSQYKILQMVQNHPHVQQKVIAKELGQTEASISRQVKLLQANGTLNVRVNPASLREHITVLTAKGLRVTNAASDVLAQYYAQLINQFDSKQRSYFTELLEKLHMTVCSSDRSYTCDHMV